MKVRKKKADFKFKNAQDKVYRVVWRKPGKQEKAEALCYNPDGPDPRIFLDPHLLERRKMAVIIEEFAHAFFWDKNEKEVRKFSATLRTFLYKSGWKKTT
jgi:hypothetical protein